MLGAPMALINQPPLSKRQYLRELIYQKRKWDEPLSSENKAKGFLGWHERGYLPHCDKPGLTQFVTLRLIDSLPASRRREWEHLLKIEDLRKRRVELESYLDRGIGKCALSNHHVAQLTEDAILFDHGRRYEILAWCVMPNHCHILVHIWDWPLSKILQNWKSITAIQANRSLGRSGSFWQREYWDTYMRDSGQELKAIRYIESNPIKARLCQAPENWPFSSARFRDEYRRLRMETMISRNKAALKLELQNN